MRIKIKVIPNSSKDEVVEGDLLIVRTKSPPTKGKANRSVVKILSKHFGSDVKLISGASSREKWVEVIER
ncbi:MAG: DUF167 domain-containing protein [Halobacteriota archaeon]|nr:DUF167 domain-containing protein [Halobacteriota archaeon]